jgi:hypothetical protein
MNRVLERSYYMQRMDTVEHPGCLVYTPTVATNPSMHWKAASSGYHLKRQDFADRVGIPSDT